MYINNSSRTSKGSVLSLSVFIACSADVLAANQMIQTAKPAAPAPHSENNAQIHNAQHTNGFQGHAGYHNEARSHYAFHARDVRGFRGEDLARWQAGRWRNTCFNGRCGYWWFAAGQWYFYDQPQYPYPLVVSQIEYVEPVAISTVPADAPMRLAPPPKFRYYCDEPRGHYPSVGTCNTQFRQVTIPPPH